ncbi:ATP-binding protein [Thorsellia anophelis]|uniref:histidine kinase n=1 Tax=Thorsellia anophelis DSM 18579 TaxID=1123402 RepID=A0A1I0F115_9GAMM|nr:ATP-binding protein [Thorsellia anophelis]SET51684.1 two-component system, OmpR family, sensor kinase [Thorsellia anophelis DSM 18579]
MRLSLFWKILIGFWVAFILAVQMLWVVVAVHHDEADEVERQINWRISSAIDALRHGGPRELELILRTWPPQQTDYIKVEAVDESKVNALNNPYFPISDPKRSYESRKEKQSVYNEYVMAPDNILYHLQYDADKVRSEYLSLTDRYLFNIHEPLMFLGLFGGFIFSSFMAWNLARPLKFIRQGFARVAQGDLSVRLFPKLKRRKDEITDVARDFDHMVGRIDQLSSAREQLLHDISHELRTPLARIRIALGLAQQKSENIPQTLSRIERETERLDSLIAEVLTLARIDNDAFLEEQFFDIGLLLQAIVEDVRYESAQRDVQIHFNHDDKKECTARGNAELLHRAFENILRNALKFSTTGKSIYVSLTIENDRFVIVIRDEGPGVDEDKLDFIFEAFGRVPSSGIKDGYGLGLSITKKAVLAHNGEIRATNHPEGGLSIRVTLPIWEVNHS